MQLNQASKLAKPDPARYSSISHYSCPPGWVQRFNLISLEAFPSVNFTLIHLQVAKEKMQILHSTFYRFMSFLPVNLYKTAHKLGIKQKYICCQPPSHFLEVSTLVIRCMFCKEAPQGTVRSVPGIQWTWGHAVKGSAALKASERNSVRELNDCHYNTRASVFCRSALLHFCSQEEHKNKFLPSSPRRLTSSWDNSFRCFNASSLCREKNKKPQTFGY